MTIAFILVFMFSIYTLFTASDALMLAVALLRVAITLFGLVSIRFTDDTMIYVSFFMYAIVNLSLYGIMRNEVQVKND